MDDKTIIDMLWNRDENAIKILEETYGSDLFHLSFRILGNIEDAEGCVSDTLLKVWNSIPDKNPDSLFYYCAKITRNLSFNQLKKNTSTKRGKNYIKVLLSELEDFICGVETVESAVRYHELSDLISEFLATLKKEHRVMFVKRYWYAEKTKDIAISHNCSVKKVESILFRTRRSLKKYLLERGYFNE